jgi:HTH-type transcriptional regulator/antitoxin HipB
MSYKARIKDMKTLDEVLRERMQADPNFAADLEQAKADLAVAIQIALAREKRGMTQKQLADAANYKLSAIGRLEQGNISPTVKTVRRLAHSLNARFVIEPDGEVRMEPIG